MQLRRALPLTLAALTMATGCVTVHPAAPPDAARLTPAASLTEPRQPAVPALPLGHLPTAEETAPQSPEAREPAPADPVPAAAPEPQHRAAEPTRRYRPHRPPAPYKPVTPVKPARPAPPARPRTFPPAKAKSRPAPPRTYDMTPLCEAARGTVSPSIVALCR
ncbi:hypothetical protein OG429_05675 [Streptomyces sp. NBC_00190]|nr:hypothetical protein [Streptomyces sp. NBC_00190]WSZ38862.1 hypothetical protein OG239_08685 [Streptomyces sp. NBC_00868]